MARQQVKKFRKSAPGKHQLNWLWGRESVFETLNAGRWRVYELYVTAEVLEQNADLLKDKQKEGVELEVVSNSKLEDLVQTSDHQGIVARVSKYPYQTLESLEQTQPTNAAMLESNSAQPLLVIIDRIQDTFNFASVLRCCQSAGVQAVITGEFCQAQITTQVARASSGAVNHFPIIQSPDLVVAATKVKELGFKLIAVSRTGQVVCDASLKTPIALVIGGDMHALDPALLMLCDEEVSIPMLGQKTLLNSAVSAGILLYEIRRQQR
ncbi:MAG: RNA methyltransferase [Planctomycetota bacterium]|nr:RNA methyltransferase [Planctomycetota bacterium]